MPTDHPVHSAASSEPPRPHVGPVVNDQAHRERFDTHELAIVLSHFDIGVIEQLRPYPRGSRRSPKLRIKSRRGEFLLKRRAHGQDDPFRVAFAHDLQLHLAQQNYPVPGLIGTRDDNNSMLQFAGRVYELFNYIHGTRVDGSPAAAMQAGAALGHLHRLLHGYRSPYPPGTGSFHGVSAIGAKMSLLPGAVTAVEPQTDRTAVGQTVEFLRKAYLDAAKRVDDLDFPAWPREIVHGDWHPGNLLLRDGRVVAVLDFDSSRLEPRAVDVANAALQFSMRVDAGEDPLNWPEGFDANLIRAIVRGYDQASYAPLTKSECLALPWLMVEGLIIEAIVPIVATGSFSQISGSSFLRMVERKVKWLRPRAASLSEVLMQESGA